MMAAGFFYKRESVGFIPHSSIIGEREVASKASVEGGEHALGSSPSK